MVLSGVGWAGWGIDRGGNWWGMVEGRRRQNVVAVICTDRASSKSAVCGLWRGGKRRGAFAEKSAGAGWFGRSSGSGDQRGDQHLCRIGFRNRDKHCV